MDKIKILWIGDGVISTGFARVNHSIIGNLPQEYEVHHLAINYHGDPHQYSHAIYPASLGGDIYGLGRLPGLINGIKPDLIFILNDAWMVDIYLAKLKQDFPNFDIPIVTYFPVDAEEHSEEFYRNFDTVSEVCVYTNFGKDVLLDARSSNIKARDVHIIPHGISKDLFFPVDVATAKEIVYPPDRTEEFLNSFIILNANRNQPRKRIDLSLWAFKEFQKDKPDTKIYMHMGTLDLGVDIIRKAREYGFEKKLIVSTTQPHIPNLPDRQLNLIYNATDVGINTSVGEGWGLTSWEHAFAGKLQIVPRHSALEEIWADGRALFTEIIPGLDGRQMMERISTVGRVPSVQSLVDNLEWAYKDWKYNASQESIKITRKATEYINQAKFDWKNVAGEFDKVFKKALKKR
jgi:glycosyltransferase involved in cell wall biosynthesis